MNTKIINLLKIGGKMRIATLVLFFGLTFAKNIDKYNEWRSSDTSTEELVGVYIATGLIHIHDLTVISGAVPNETFFKYHSATQTTVDVDHSTSSIYDIDTTGDYFDISDNLRGGLFITKKGTSAIRIKWDWIRTVPKGQESKGRFLR
jgi:hypothetical protein